MLVVCSLFGVNCKRTIRHPPKAEPFIESVMDEIIGIGSMGPREVTTVLG